MHSRVQDQAGRAWRNSVRWVLAAWCCVMLATIAAPYARAQAVAGWEPVCSASGPSHWVPGPAGDEVVPALHAIDCALCLPALAPPPAARFMALPVRIALESRIWHAGSLPRFAGLLPPARAPPL
jgi:hypothetical protein